MLVPGVRNGVSQWVDILDAASRSLAHGEGETPGGAPHHDVALDLGSFLDAPTLWIVLGLVIVGLFLGFVGSLMRKMQRLQKLLNEGRFDEAEAMMQRELRKKSVRLADETVYMQLSATAYYRGDFDEAWECLDRIVVERLRGAERVLYENNRLNLLLYTDLDGAREYWASHRDELEKRRLLKDFRDATESTVLAAELFLDGNLEVESKLEAIADKIRFLPAKAQLQRMLGLIARKKGQEVRAQQRLQLSEKTCPGVYLGFEI